MGNLEKFISGKLPYIYKYGYYLMLLAILSIGLYQGVIATTGSKDAQWYPTKLFSENIDFYTYYLGNYSDWFMRSVPNYYFQLYYLLYPLSSVSWENFKLSWFLLGVALLVLFLVQVKKDFGLEYKKMALLLLPFFVGFPLIAVYTNGQSTIVLIAIMYLSWKFKDNIILLPLLLSLLTIKYSFGLPIILGFLLMGYYRSVILSGLITLVFPLVYSIQFNLNFISTIFLPIKVSTDPVSNPTGGGPSNLMSLYGLFFDGPLIGINLLTICLVLFIGIFSFVAIRYRLDKSTIFICSLLLSLFGFYHNGHDHTLFLLILPFVLKMRYFKILYGYLLLFCLAPRIIRVLNMVTNEKMIGFREFMYNNKYFVIFNVCVLITFFVLLIIQDIQSKREVVVQDYV